MENQEYKERNEKYRKLLPAYLLLLAIPIIASIGLTSIKLPVRYLPPQIGRLRTEAEQIYLRRDHLEDDIDGLGMTYDQFIELSGLKRNLPAEYDNWKVSVDVNDNWINHERQTAIDYREEGLGKVVQIDLSEGKAQDILNKYIAGFGGRK